MELDVEQVILTLVIIFALAKAASYVFARFGMPGLIGEIIIGIVIVNLTIGDFNLESWLGLSPVTEGGVESESPTHMILEMFSELGVIFLLFTVGLETKVKDLTSVGRTAFLVALLGVLVPFFVGYAYVTMVDSNIYHAMFMGAAMVATSVGITARVIKDLNLMDARESRIIIGAAVIDDILGMIVLAIVSGMAETGSLNLGSIVSIALVSVVFVVAIILVAAKLVPAFYKSVEERNEAICERRSMGKLLGRMRCSRHADARMGTMPYLADRYSKLRRSERIYSSCGYISSSPDAPMSIASIFCGASLSRRMAA